MNNDTDLIFEAYASNFFRSEPLKKEEATESEDERYDREASEMEDIRLKYYTDVYRKIQKGDMMIGDFIEWCTHQDVMPLRGE
jgi:hypothetical protein